MARLKTALLFSLTFFVLQVSLTGQTPAHIAGELLVQMKEDTDFSHWLTGWNRSHPVAEQLRIVKQVSRPVNIWLVSFDENQTTSQRLISVMNDNPQVSAVQRNHSITLRAVPDDALFLDQWQYQNTGQSGGTVGADIDAVEAWDVTTGGTTLTGDTIVVAVLDNGIDVTHPDFQVNRWYNHGEIPGNGIDDDGNEYTDDYAGWNTAGAGSSTTSGNDNIGGGSHGTAVAGVIGADGNNGIGVSGVNWNVKVMNIRNNFNTSDAEIVEAYSYVLEQRRRYNDSGGAEGAFVVATNASWGVDGGQPDDAPIWCNFYETLGAAGILNFGATANDDVDVDLEGDLPTACPSDFLVAVTNTNHNDEKVVQAGYGITTIDLGAPGAGAYTLTNGGNYNGFGGTSGATPHVTGTAALLYSLDCPALSALTESDPAAAALLVREAILEGVTPNASLAGITVTGGRLNVMNSIQYLLDRCDGCIPATSVQVADLGVTEATINWNINDSLQSVDLRWRAVGAPDWTLIENAVSPLTISDLTACADYEYQLQSNCNSDTIPFGNSRFFITDGCCTAPENIILTELSNEAIRFDWDAVTAAQGYEIRYRIQGASAWEEQPTATNQVTLVALEACTNYEYQLKTICANETTEYTDLTTFLTGGCGPCLDLEYCTLEGIFSNQYEHIAGVAIGGFFTNISEANAGYVNFGETVDAPVLETGTIYPIQLTPGFAATGPAAEDWRIWLDSDHNGFFTTNEIIYDGDSSNEPINDFITIPPDSQLGLTRMRVMMVFSNLSSGPCPFMNQDGEVEDYCVELIAPLECPAAEEFNLNVIDINTVRIAWGAISQALDYAADYRSADDLEWLPLTVNQNMVDIVNLDSCVDYTLRVKTFCNGSESDGYSTYEFNACTVGTQDIAVNETNWQLAPNPFRDQLEIRALNFPTSGKMTYAIMDGLGRRVVQADWPQGGRSTWVATNHWPAGMYVVAIYRDGKLWGTKRGVKP